MAKTTKILGLPLTTIIEVISIKDDKVYKKEMTIEEANKMERKKGFIYKFYQVGFSSFKNVINIKSK